MSKSTSLNSHSLEAASAAKVDNFISATWRTKMYDAEMKAERVASATSCAAEQRIVENNANKTKEADKPLSAEE